MGVAACLRWEVRMAQITSTHRHDFRWPTADCLVPRAEAPNGKCVPPPPGGLGSNKPWCGRDKPQATPPGPMDAGGGPRACYDIAPDPKDPPKPWCQRGPLVEMLSTRTPSAPPQVKIAPKGCEIGPPPTPWCEADAPPRPLAAKVGAAPQQDTSRYDQPNQYLRKLCDKFPEPVSVITAKPRDELMRRVYADRYRTTYQADYCRNLDDIARMVGECDYHDVTNNQFKQQTWEGQEQTQGGYDMQRGPGAQSGSCKCGCGGDGGGGGGGGMSGGDGGEPRIRPLACRPAAVSKNFHFTCCTLKKSDRVSADHVGPPEKIPPWVSEYNDSIGKTAQQIMEYNLLSPKKEKKHKL